MSASGNRSIWELKKLQLEVAEQEARAANRWRPGRWERWGDTIKWLGIVIPVVISVAVLIIEQRKDRELEEDQLAQRKLEAMAFALENLKGMPEAITLYLSRYGDDAVPILVGLVSVEGNSNDANWPWPATTFAALEALGRIGFDKLGKENRTYLRQRSQEGYLRFQEYLEIPRVTRDADTALQQRGRDTARVTARILCAVSVDRTALDRLCTLRGVYETEFATPLDTGACPILKKCPEDQAAPTVE